jgi:hypothetical protein
VLLARELKAIGVRLPLFTSQVLLERPISMEPRTTSHKIRGRYPHPSDEDGKLGEGVLDGCVAVWLTAIDVEPQTSDEPHISLNAAVGSKG